MKLKMKTENIVEYLKMIEKLNDYEISAPVSRNLIFRGVKNEHYNLIPSIYRIHR